MNKILLFVLYAIAGICAAYCVERRPIVLMPGIMGTILHGSANIPPEVPLPDGCARTFDDTLMWIDEATLLQLDCAMTYFRYEFNPVSRDWDRLKGMTFSVPKWSSTYAIDELAPGGFSGSNVEYFHNMIGKLESLGYVDGDNLLGIGYDWKEVPSEKMIQDSKDLIERTVQKFGTRVLLIAHSMGCPYSYYFLSRMGDDWVKQNIFMYVPIAPPWMGSVRAVDSMLGGLDRELPFVGKYLAPLIRHIPSVWFLLPNPLAFPNMILATTPNKVYYYTDMLQSFNDGNLTNVEGKMSAARYFFGNISNYEHLPPIPVRQIIGTNKKTVIGIKFPYDIKPLGADDLWPDFDRVYGEGDSTVPYDSMIYAYDIWERSGFDVQLFKYPGLSHMDLVQDDTVIDQVIHFACDTDP